MIRDVIGWVYKLYLKQYWNLARRAGISHMRFIYQKTRYEKTSGDRHRAKFTKPPARNWRNSQWEIYLRKLLPAQAQWRIKHICEWGLHNDMFWHGKPTSQNYEKRRLSYTRRSDNFGITENTSWSRIKSVSTQQYRKIYSCLITLFTNSIVAVIAMSGNYAPLLKHMLGVLKLRGLH